MKVLERSSAEFADDKEKAAQFKDLREKVHEYINAKDYGLDFRNVPMFVDNEEDIDDSVFTPEEIERMMSMSHIDDSEINPDYRRMVRDHNGAAHEGDRRFQRIDRVSLDSPHDHLN
jgi:hypothetical protein